MEPPPKQVDDAAEQQHEPLTVEVVEEHDRTRDTLRRDVKDAVVAELRARDPSHPDRP
jgi:hypothetical protein